MPCEHLGLAVAAWPAPVPICVRLWVRLRVPLAQESALAAQQLFSLAEPPCLAAACLTHATHAAPRVALQNWGGGVFCGENYRHMPSPTPNVSSGSLYQACRPGADRQSLATSGAAR